MSGISRYGSDAACAELVMHDLDGRPALAGATSLLHCTRSAAATLPVDRPVFRLHCLVEHVRQGIQVAGGPRRIQRWRGRIR
jgi:hypothetical protein